MGVNLRTYNFYYRVSGEKAEQLLNDYGENGDFLARFSESSPSNFSLTIRIDNRPLHIKVQKINDMLSIFGGNEGSDAFGSLVELLEYYIDNPTKLRERNGGYVSLKKPLYVPYEVEDCAKEQRLVQMNRWFHSNLTAPESIAILDKEKSGSFLLRFSQHLPGALVISAKVDNSVVHLTIHQDPMTGKYTIDGDNTEYCDIRQLLATYNKNPIVEKAMSSRVVYLENPVTSSSTFVPADVIADRFELLKQNMEPGNSERTGISEEFARLQAEQAPAEQYFSKREGRREMNVDKNRYKNIVPFDHTRVILKDRSGVPGSSDYINASYVKFDKPQAPLTLFHTRTYIATQGCMENTISDFWAMIWQENSRVVVMPTRENERREKCSRYWPELNETNTYADISITNTEEQHVKKGIPDELKGHVEEPDDKDISYIIRTFNVKKNGAPAPRIIRHLQFISWPDHGCPCHPYEVISFLEAVDCAHRQFKNLDVKQGPVVVHCSAGIGRTGTFIILDVLLTQVKRRGRDCPIDIWRTTRHARNYRGGLVQTEQQYQFLYNSLSYFVRKTNPHEEQRLVLRERGHSSSILPMIVSNNHSGIRMPDVAQAYIGPSAPPITPPLPHKSNKTKQRAE